jgi:stage V sporulation protein B
VSRKESLLHGAAALAVAGLIIKVSNLLVRVPLTRLMTAEGLGIYQMALPAFYALFHIAAGGVPVAVQNLVTEYTTKGRRPVAEQVMRMALAYAVLAGGGATLFLMAAAPVLARLIGEPRAAWSLMAVAPAVLLFAADGIYRNYLQGRKLMTPSATASVLEQGVKVAVTVAAAYALMPRGKAMAAAGAALGITAGALVSLLYMMHVYQRMRREDMPVAARPESRTVLARRMLRLAWPVTVGSVSMPLLSLLDVGIVQRGFLRAGYTQSEATALYGAYAGIAVQVTWFPFVLTNAFANALMPLLSSARARGDDEAVYHRVVWGLKATALICLPVALGIAVLARPIALLFGDAAAALPLTFMAPVAILGPLAWLMIMQLQSLGQTAKPTRNYVIAMLIKLGLDVLLAPIRGIDVRGVAVASVILFLVLCGLNARTLEQEVKAPLPWLPLFQGPLLAAAGMGLGLVGLGRLGVLPAASWLLLAVVALVGPVFYLTGLILTRSLTWREVREWSGPLGQRLERWAPWLQWF